MSTVHSTQPDLRILLAEEDDAIRAFLADNLTADGYHVYVAEDRDRALARLRVATVDLILADVNGKTLSLLDWVRSADSSLRAISSDTPVIVLTSQIDDVHHVRLLERGGDDVVLKPFSYPELRGRIRVLLRRAYEPRPTPVSRVGALSVNHRTREVRVGDRQVALAAKEFGLLQTLIAEPTRVFTKEELLRSVWGYRTPSRTVDSHACRLRQKLASPDRRLVIPVWGVGYRLCDPAVYGSHGAS